MCKVTHASLAMKRELSPLDPLDVDFQPMQGTPAVCLDAEIDDTVACAELESVPSLALIGAMVCAQIDGPVPGREADMTASASAGADQPARGGAGEGAGSPPGGGSTSEWDRDRWRQELLRDCTLRANDYIDSLAVARDYKADGYRARLARARGDAATAMRIGKRRTLLATVASIATETADSDLEGAVITMATEDYEATSNTESLVTVSVVLGHTRALSAVHDEVVREDAFAAVASRMRDDKMVAKIKDPERRGRAILRVFDSTDANVEPWLGMALTDTAIPDRIRDDIVDRITVLTGSFEVAMHISDPWRRMRQLINQSAYHAQEHLPELTREAKALTGNPQEKAALIDNLLEYVNDAPLAAELEKAARQVADPVRSALYLSRVLVQTGDQDLAAELKAFVEATPREVLDSVYEDMLDRIAIATNDYTLARQSREYRSVTRRIMVRLRDVDKAWDEHEFDILSVIAIENEDIELIREMIRLHTPRSRRYTGTAVDVATGGQLFYAVQHKAREALFGLAMKQQSLEPILTLGCGEPPEQLVADFFAAQRLDGGDEELTLARGIAVDTVRKSALTSIAKRRQDASIAIEAGDNSLATEIQYRLEGFGYTTTNDPLPLEEIAMISEPVRRSNAYRVHLRSEETADKPAVAALAAGCIRESNVFSVPRWRDLIMIGSEAREPAYIYEGLLGLRDAMQSKEDLDTVITAFEILKNSSLIL